MENSRLDKTYYNAIDMAKFICAILVIMIHVAPFGTSTETKWINNVNFGIQNYLARIAVPFFFMASGFFLYTKTCLEYFDIEPIKQYVLKLFRLYIIWSVIYFPLKFKNLVTEKKGLPCTILEYIRDVIFTGSYRHLWYLNALIFDVVLITYLLYKHCAPRKILIIACIFYFFGLFAQSWFGFIVPLREWKPYVWDLLKLIQKVIVTTRDGLFEGFIFVGLGMIFAFYKVNITKKQAVVGFMFSMFLMFVEFFVLEHFNFAREHDMYLFLVPVIFFMFSIICGIKLPKSEIYKNLRILSTLIFYMHLWVASVINQVLKMISSGLETTCLKFILTLIVTIVCSIIVIRVSNTSKFKWLKRLYS